MTRLTVQQGGGYRVARRGFAGLMKFIGLIGFVRCIGVVGFIEFLDFLGS